MEYLLWAFAAFGAFALFAIMAEVRKRLRNQRWEARLDALREDMAGVEHAMTTGVVTFTAADKEAMLSLITGKAEPSPKDALAFEIAINVLSNHRTGTLTKLQRLVQDRGIGMSAAGYPVRTLALRAISLAIEAELLMRGAPDNIGYMIANGNKAKALLVIWPDADPKKGHPPSPR